MILHDVAAMQVDEVYEILENGILSRMSDTASEFVNYCDNIRERRDLTEQYHFTLFLANLLTTGMACHQRAIVFNLFVQSHGFNRTLTMEVVK